MASEAELPDPRDGMPERAAEADQEQGVRCQSGDLLEGRLEPVPLRRIGKAGDQPRSSRRDLGGERCRIAPAILVVHVEQGEGPRRERARGVSDDRFGLELGSGKVAEGVGSRRSQPGRRRDVHRHRPACLGKRRDGQAGAARLDEEESGSGPRQVGEAGHRPLRVAAAVPHLQLQADAASGGDGIGVGAGDLEGIALGFPELGQLAGDRQDGANAHHARRRRGRNRLAGADHHRHRHRDGRELGGPHRDRRSPRHRSASVRPILTRPHRRRDHDRRARRSSEVCQPRGRPERRPSAAPPGRRARGRPGWPPGGCARRAS